MLYVVEEGKREGEGIGPSNQVHQLCCHEYIHEVNFVNVSRPCQCYFTFQNGF